MYAITSNLILQTSFVIHWFFSIFYRVTIYNEPHLRSRLDLHRDPVHWVPADDFTDVFCFIDRTKGGNDVRGGGGGEGGGGGGGGGSGGGAKGGVGEVWDLVVDQGNQPWDYDTGKPLYK